MTCKPLSFCYLMHLDCVTATLFWHNGLLLTYISNRTKFFEGDVQSFMTLLAFMQESLYAIIVIRNCGVSNIVDEKTSTHEHIFERTNNRLSTKQMVNGTIFSNPVSKVNH